jgi:hypothetical protein
MATRMSPLRSAKAKAHAFAGMRRQVGTIGAEQDGDRLEVRAPPGEARPERRQVEGIDGRGHVESVFTISCHENARHFPEFHRCGRHRLCRWRRNDLQYGWRHRAPHRTARMGRVVLAIGVPGCLNVATTFAAAPWRAGRCPQRRPGVARERRPACRKFRQLHPCARPRAGRQRAAYVRRHPFITALLARLFLGEPIHGHTVLTMAAAGAGWPSAWQVPCRAVPSPAWPWRSSSCCA